MRTQKKGDKDMVSLTRQQFLVNLIIQLGCSILLCKTAPCFNKKSEEC